MKGLPRVNGEHREISMCHLDKLMDSVLRLLLGWDRTVVSLYSEYDRSPAAPW